MSNETSNQLCSTCMHIIDTVRQADWHRDLMHHDSFASFKNSANQACGICTTFLHFLQDYNSHLDDEMWHHLFPIKCDCDTSAATWQSSFELNLKSDLVEWLNLTYTLELIDESEGDYESTFLILTRLSSRSNFAFEQKRLICVQTLGCCR